MINILMLGGKRCGKTTVLASMYNNIDEALAGTNLKIVADPQTALELKTARDNIQRRLDDFKQELTRIKVDDNATNAMRTYNFNLYANNKSVPFKIHDVPGEWLVNQQNKIKDLVKKCQVIIIAIDTPYLFAKMGKKGYGLYHEEYNKPIEIANFFKNSLSIENVEDRMILFVPIKCERYYHLTNTPKLNVYHRNYMQEIIDAIACGYSDLLAYLRSTPQLLNSCTIAITPILSAGGIDFVHFCKDPQTGKMVSLYQEPEFVQQSESKYSPKFCAQPMIYSIIYVLKQELNNSKKKSLFTAFRNMSSTEIYAAIETLRKKLKRNTGSFSDDGYYIIQNPKDI